MDKPPTGLGERNVVDLGSYLTGAEDVPFSEDVSVRGNVLLTDVPIDIRIFVGHDKEWEAKYGGESIRKVEQHVQRAQEFLRFDSLYRSFILKIVGHKKYNFKIWIDGDVEK